MKKDDNKNVSSWTVLWFGCSPGARFFAYGCSKPGETRGMWVKHPFHPVNGIVWGRSVSFRKARALSLATFPISAHCVVRLQWAFFLNIKTPTYSGRWKEQDQRIIESADLLWHASVNEQFQLRCEFQVYGKRHRGAPVRSFQKCPAALQLLY